MAFDILTRMKKINNETTGHSEQNDSQANGSNIRKKYRTKTNANSNDNPLPQNAKFTGDIKTSIEDIKQQIKNCDDLIFRSIKIANTEAICVFLFTLVDKTIISDTIDELQHHPYAQSIGDFSEYLVQHVITAAQVQVNNDFQGIISGIVMGKMAILVEEASKAVLIETFRVPSRQPEQPFIEASSRGSQASFVEPLETNIGMIRSYFKTSTLCVRILTVGVRSQTRVAVCYLNDVANNVAIDTVIKRIQSIHIDLISQSGSIQDRISDNHWTIFPLLRPTQRIDNTAREINQGKFALLIENDPTVLLGPATLQDFYQTEEDYLHSFYEATFVRFLRIIAFFLALFLPSLYISLTEFNPELLPTMLSLRIAASRSGVPFPAVIEVLIIELVIEILREATLRMPKQMGPTVGIVGGLVIGQATVSAGLASNILIVIVAVTAIATFVPPSYEISASFRVTKWFLFVGSCFFGIYGMILTFMIVLFHLASLKSFGVEYLAPLTGKYYRDWMDLIIRFPTWMMKKRTEHLNPKDQIGETNYENPALHPRLVSEDSKRSQENQRVKET